MEKKGFTLIELLAVIVILAVIALIATPMVMNTIAGVKKGACSASSKEYVRIIETNILNQKLIGVKIYNGTYTIKDGNLYDQNNALALEVEMKGKVPTSGSVEIVDELVVNANLTIDECAVSYDGKDYAVNLGQLSPTPPQEELVYPVGCQLGETPYGVTKTEQNTICFDGNINHYENVEYTSGGSATVNGVEVPTRIVWVKISSKTIDSSNYDGQNYLIHYSNPGNTDEVEENFGLTDDNCIGTGTGKELATVEVGENSTLFGFGIAILSLNSNETLFDNLSAGTWFSVMLNADTNEPLFYPDAITIETLDFTGTSLKLPENADLNLVGPTKIETYYSGNKTGKAFTETLRNPEENPEIIAGFVKVADLTQQDALYLNDILGEIMTNPDARFRLIGKTVSQNAELAEDIDMELTSEDIKTVIGASEDGTVKYITYDGDPVYILSAGGSLDGHEFLSGVYVIHYEYSGSYAETFKATYVYLQHFSLELLP